VELLNEFLKQLGVVQHAWIPFLLAVAVAAIVSWRSMEWRYGGTIARLKEQAEGPKPKQIIQIRAAPPEKGVKALESLRSARGNAAVALHQGNHHTQRRAFHECEAAMLNVKREFGIEPMKIPEIAGDPPYGVLVEAYLSFIDRFYPLLREGHVEEAKARRDSFNWSWGQA
jgi:hypothetical protein